MSWQNTSLLMLRTMLNDAGVSETRYSTQRLEELLITSAYFLPLEINFDTEYTVNVASYSISPDPGGSTPPGDGDEFISFMVLKASCLADEGNFRTAALLQGVNARIGPAHLNTSQYGVQLATLLTQGPCKSFEDLKEQYNFSYEGKKIIRAVMSPFAANKFDPRTMLGSMGEADTENPFRNRGGYGY
tara:strand:- start:247 stop:810 length:564 start_codon:yes stop_codon:yes gene_type:complete